MLWLWKKHYDYESDEQLDEKPDEQTVEQPDKQPDTTDMLNWENEELAAQKNIQAPTQSARHTKRDTNKRHWHQIKCLVGFLLLWHKCRLEVTLKI